MASSVLKLPRYLPCLSVFNLPIFSSNHISLPPRVDSPTSFCATFRTRCLDTIFPFDPLPFIASSPKLKSNIFLRAFTELCRFTITISDSLFGFAVKYNNCDLPLPCVISYSRSLMMEVTEKRLAYEIPVLPSK